MAYLKLNPNTINLTKAELHTHSTFSDGVFDPEVLASKCSDKDVKFWVLSDHDTCSGCKRAADAASSHGIRFLPGIEISAFHGRSVHVLGYGVDPERIEDYSREQVARRRKRMGIMVERLASKGIDIGFDDIVLSAHADVYTRPHLARALIQKGYATSVKDAFDRYLSSDGDVYVKSNWPPVEQAIDIIHDAGGVALLAHPGIYKNEEGNLDSMISRWKERGLDGIEASHPRHSSAEEEKFKQIALKLDLFWTSSSDFHGPETIGSDRFGSISIPGAILDRLSGV